MNIFQASNFATVPLIKPLAGTLASETTLKQYVDSQGKGKSQNKCRPTVNKVGEDESSDKVKVYTLFLSRKTMKDPKKV